MPKKLITFFIVLTFCLKGQNPLFTVWNKTVDLVVGEQDIGQNVFELNDKRFVVSQYYNLAYNSWGVITSTWDSSGTMLNSKAFIDSTYFSLSLNKSIEVDDRVVYGVGYAQKLYDTINDLDLYFVKYNAAGDTVFTKIFRDTGSVTGYDIVKLKPNIFAVLCQSAPEYWNVIKSRTYVLLLDSLGNVLKDKYVVPSYNQSYYLVHSPITHELYTLGIRPAPGNSWYSFLHAFDDSTLSLKYTKTDLAGKNNVINAAIFHEGSLYATFTSEVLLPVNPYYTFETNHIKVCKFTVSSQTLATTAVYNIPPNDTTKSAYTANLLADGNHLIFAGLNAYTGLNIYFCDTLLKEKCRARVPAPATMTDSDVNYWSTCLTHSKKLLSTGFMSDYSLSLDTVNSITITWVSESTNYLDYIANNCGNPLGIEENTNEFLCKLYPNPGSDYIHIVLNNTSNISEPIKIIDAAGRICLTDTLDLSAELSLNISNLPPGIYSVSIGEGHGKWHSKLVKR